MTTWHDGAIGQATNICIGVQLKASASPVVLVLVGAVALLCCAILTNEMVEDGALLKRVSNAVVAAVDVLELEPPVGGLPPWSPRL